MQHFQRGKEAAFEELYQRYSKRLLHFMYRMLNGNETRAQDLLQDLFLKLIEQPRAFDPERNFKAWIFTVAANLCRREYRQPNLVELDEAPDESEIEGLLLQVDRKLFKAQLKEELKRLSYEQQVAFILRYQEHFSIKEIAAVMDCAPGTVKSRLHYAVKKLAQRMQQFNPTNH